jgi:hypothetical protein
MVQDEFKNSSSAATPSVPVANSTSVAIARVACLQLANFGTWASRGFVVLGVLYPASQLIHAARAELSAAFAWTNEILLAICQFLAFALAGWGIGVMAKLVSVSIATLFDHASRLSDDISSQASRALALLEQIALETGHRDVAPSSSSPKSIERARSTAEILRATGEAEWAEAENRLSEFEIQFPDDPELRTLRDELKVAREGAIGKSLAQLEAAREVNDTNRVLEIYDVLARSLEGPQRDSLDNELAKWFLSLIHRRLRSGKVQAEVVHLAARFADTFATTVEGASVRASLPTLRRSVGLCPRCAQPYTGVAEACPQCLKSASQRLPTGSPSLDADPPP